MTNLDLDALVLSTREYRESDAIVTFLCEDRSIDVLARGVSSMKSKNRQLIQPLSFVHIAIQKKSRGFPLLLYGHVNVYYHRIQEDLIAQAVCFVLRDLVSFMPKNPSIFHYYRCCWESFHNKDSRAFGYACILLKEVILHQGIQPYMKGCTHCGRTNHIEAISPKAGGFVCVSCNPSHTNKQTKEFLQRSLSLYRIDQEQVEDLLSFDTFSMLDFLFWAEWIEYHTGQTFSSIRFLRSIQ